MKSSAPKARIVFWRITSLLLAFLLALLLYGAWANKMPVNARSAEQKGQRVVIGLESGSPASELGANSLADENSKVPMAAALLSPVAPPLMSVPLVSKPRIVIILSNLEEVSAGMEQAIELPAVITLGFSPYAPEAEQWAERARQEQHDMLLTLPIEFTKESVQRLESMLARFPHIAGIYSATDENLSTDLDKLRPVLDSIKARNLLFLYGGNVGHIQPAGSIALPLFAVNLRLDEKTSQPIEQQLSELEKIARHNGYAIGMGTTDPLVITALENWLGTVEAKGVEIIPISALMNSRK
jgi:uncharacterized protein